jgi:Cdc6-like AAA superfamily ATPase
MKTVCVNCTSISLIGSIYEEICSELSIKLSLGTTEKDFLAAFENYLIEKKHKMNMLVLDGIDQLVREKQSVLYWIFEWLPDSRIILIGITNQLDLTDRSLSRHQTKCELKPKLMHFPPHTKQQIVEIFTKRLEEGGVLDLFPPVTIQLLAAKVSAVSGDIRRALSIENRVIEMAEEEMRKSGKFADLKKLEAVVEENGDESSRNWIFIWIVHSYQCPRSPLQLHRVTNLTTTTGTTQFANASTANQLNYCQLEVSIRSNTNTNKIQLKKSKDFPKNINLTSKFSITSRNTSTNDHSSRKQWNKSWNSLLLSTPTTWKNSSRSSRKS